MSLNHVRHLSETEERQLLSDYGYGFKYVVIRPISVSMQLSEDGEEHTVTVPEGFLCDRCPPQCFNDLGERGWLLHDWLYASHSADDGTPVTQEEADKLVLHDAKPLALTYFGSAAWGIGGTQGPQVNIDVARANFGQAKPVWTLYCLGLAVVGLIVASRYRS